MTSHATESTLAGWRRRWAAFALLWVTLVLALACALWPLVVSPQDGRLVHADYVLSFGLLTVLPPAVDFVVSLGIARLLLHRRKLQ